MAWLWPSHGQAMAGPWPGFGRAIVTVGKLIVVDRTLRDVHRFGFDSLEKLIAEVEKVTSKAITLVNQHRDVAKL